MNSTDLLRNVNFLDSHRRYEAEVIRQTDKKCDRGFCTIDFHIPLIHNPARLLRVRIHKDRETTLLQHAEDRSQRFHP
jgi:hypothetical protein